MTWAGWNDENTAAARHLFEVELRSAAEVARMIGATRNAVIGKMQRLGIKVDVETKLLKQRRARPTPAPKPPRAPRPDPAPKAGGSHKAPKVMSRKNAPEDTSHRIAWIDRPFGRACAFIVDDEALTGCGAPVSGRGSYCAHHAAICYRPTKVAA